MELAYEGSRTQESRAIRAESAKINSFLCLCFCSDSINFVINCDMKDSFVNFGENC